MMTFTFDGTVSSDKNVYLAQSTVFTESAERDVETFEVPGRSGELTIDNGRYKNREVPITVYMPSGFKDGISSFTDWISSLTGYKIYRESLFTDRYVMARVKNCIKISSSNPYIASFEITLDVCPQKYLDSGTTTTTYTASGTITNPTNQIAKPLLKITGTGYFTLNGTKITISGKPSAGYFYLDLESCDAYLDGENCNTYVGMTNLDYPVLNPGSNSLVISGLTSVEVTGRWYVI